ncbi:MAG TPA: carbohydrate kinase [Propylenella sp.]
MILCHGEMLIDFIPTAARDGSLCYRPAVGGSPGNVAVTLARLDVPVGFVGGLSTDFFGEEIVATLERNGVSTAHVSRLDRPTMLAFVNLEGEEPRYAFYDAEAAPRNWRLADMPALGPEVKALHFGSLSLSRMPAAQSFEALMEREAGRRIVSFDPNIRAGLVDDEADYRRRLQKFLGKAHVIKTSGADLDWIAPGRPPAGLAAEWLAAAARLVLLTRGVAGATIFTRRGSVSRPAMPIKVADTVGAGDSTMGGLLAALHDRDALEVARLDQLTDRDLGDILDFVLAVAAITCSRVGADPPRRAEVADMLRQAASGQVAKV